MLQSKHDHVDRRARKKKKSIKKIQGTIVLYGYDTDMIYQKLPALVQVARVSNKN